MATLEQGVGADVYAARIVRTLNDGFITLMMSIGHRTGLFDTLSTLPPSTSAQVAEAAGLDERYVREWLGAMTTGRIIEFDSATATYSLPVEYAAVLTRAAGPNNLATAAQFLPLLGAAEEQVVAAFRNGGGVHYEQFARFHEVMADERAKSVGPESVEAILALMPGMREKLVAGAEVLDVGCGRGRMMNVMAAMFPASMFRGYDLSAEAIAAAREEADERGLRNTGFEVVDVAELHEPRSYDLITALDAIHDQAWPTKVLQNVAAALRPDGVFMMQDIAASSQLQQNVGHPFAPMLYTISTMHCMTVSLAFDGEGLGTMWGEERARQMLADAGFTSFVFERLETDPVNYYCIARP
ncbi:MAG TPA: methyltransferase domain-containing protein [Thermoanaerobaculia bacterium]